MEIKESILETLHELNDEEKLGMKGDSISDYFSLERSQNIILKNKLFTTDNAIHLRKHTRFIQVPLHSHDYVECAYVISGTISHIIDSKRLDMYAGELLLINEGARHEVLPCSENDIGINFIIKPSFLQDILIHCSEDSTFSDFIIHNYINHSTSKDYYVFRDVSCDLKSMLALIINHYYTNDSQEKINLLFTYVLAELLTTHMPKNQRNSSYDTDYIIFKTKKYINREYAHGSLEELSKILNISYSHLSTCIKKELGNSFKQLQQVKRLEMAMHLITKSNMPIKEIAHMIGYENMTFFYKLFKQQYNSNPYHFRK